MVVCLHGGLSPSLWVEVGGLLVCFVCCFVFDAFCSLCSCISRFLLFEVCNCFHFYYMYFSYLAVSRGFLDFNFCSLHIVTPNKLQMFMPDK